MNKCDKHTSECSLIACQKAQVCIKYFFLLPLKERLQMRLRWLPLREYYKEKDLVFVFEKAEYESMSGKQLVHSLVNKLSPEKYISPKPITKNVKPPNDSYLKKRIRVYNKYNGICWLCNKHVGITEFSIDHVKPLSKDGNGSMENLRPAHKDCNGIKGSHEIKSSEEFYLHILHQSKVDKGFSEKKRKLISEFEKAGMAHRILNPPPPKPFPPSMPS